MEDISQSFDLGSWITDEDLEYDPDRIMAEVCIQDLRTYQDRLAEMETSPLNILGTARWAFANQEWEILFEIAATISASLKTLSRGQEITSSGQQWYDYWNLGAELQELVMEASRQTGDLSHEAEYTYNLAEFRTAQGKLLADDEYEEPVETLYQRALALWEKLDKLQDQADAHEGLGKLRALQDKYRKAIEHYKTALEIRRTSKDRSGAMRTFIQLGEAHYELGEYPEALKCASLSLDLAGDLGDLEGQAAALHQRGLAYAAQGRYKQVWTDLTASLRLSEEQDDRGAIAETCLALTTVALRQRRYTEAMHYAKRAQEFFQHQGDAETRALANLRLGIALCALEEWHAAYEHLKENPGSWRKLVGKASVEHQAEAHYWLGRTLIGLGEYEAALEHLDQAKQLWEDTGRRAAAWDARWEMWKLRVRRRFGLVETDTHNRGVS